MKVILDHKQLELTLKRLCKQLIENHDSFENTVVIGLQPRGIFFARSIVKLLNSMLQNSDILYGDLDATFYRDDFMHRDAPVLVNETTIDFNIEGKKVVLIDDVLYTGRTIRAALDALTDFGRPARVELMVLINRRFRRHLPISPDYVGKEVDTIISQKVKVLWDEDEKDHKILLIDKELQSQ